MNALNLALPNVAAASVVFLDRESNVLPPGRPSGFRPPTENELCPRDAGRRSAFALSWSRCHQMKRFDSLLHWSRSETDSGFRLFGCTAPFCALRIERLWLRLVIVLLKV